MNLQKDKYIILELIPTHSNKEKGFVAQISALKIDGLKLLDRFDYRVDDKFIENPQIKSFLQYAKQDFTYVDNIYFIPEKFKRWVQDYPLLIMENNYTRSYLSEIDNKKELIYPYLNMEYSEDIINKIVDKYNLEPSEHIVDLLYEAIIYEGNNREKND